MQTFDVVIVGAGPSGVMSAITISKSGYSVALIDRKAIDRIGHKNCGDAIDINHLNHLKDILEHPEPLIENGEARSLIKRISIAAAGLDTKITAEKLDGFIVDRLKFGQKLLKIAIDHGTTVFDNTTVKDIIIDDNHVAGVICSHKERGTEEIRANITIDASGYTGKIRKLIPDDIRGNIDLTLPDKYAIASYREIIELEEPHEYEKEILWFYHSDIPIPGYLWIFTEGEKKLNIGITWPKNIAYTDGKSLKELYHQFLDPYFDPASYKVKYAGGGNIPMRPPFDSLVFNGVMIVGDAAAGVDPTTFEGHGPSLEAGRYAGKAAIEALKKGSFKQADLWSYNYNFAQYPGSTFAQSFILGRLLTKMGTDKLAMLMKRNIISEDDLIATFQDPDVKMSIWSQLGKLIRAFPHWGLMFKLKKTLDLLDDIKELYISYPKNANGIDEWIARRDKLFRI